jgi:DNA-directed RNA polymerase subunit H (RpoH/RPB5)
MHLIVEPSEEKLPQVEETDVDIAAEEFGELVRIVAKSTTVPAHL